MIKFHYSSSHNLPSHDHLLLFGNIKEEEKEEDEMMVSEMVKFFVMVDISQFIISHNQPSHSPIVLSSLITNSNEMMVDGK